ncbi:pectinesterase family protein [Pelagicoccus sp. SDUM812003]|nr:pectinesterase family protein [Pelagicoccus sp. SDUM812003]
MLGFRVALLLLVFFVASSSHAAYRTSLVVAADGSGDFERIQDAIDDCKSFPDLPITITIKQGRYAEKVTVHPWNPKINLVGEGKVVISNDSFFDQVDRGRNSTFFTATLEVLADDFTARNLTIENGAGPVGQAIALRVEGDRCAFFDCRILGNQDTLYVAGSGSRQYFENCYIEGTTDYVFGAATAFFQSCELMSKADSFITAASTPAGAEHGLVFKECRLTASHGLTEVVLGRPWRPHAKTVYLSCNYTAPIASFGWGDWGLDDPGSTVFYAEYVDDPKALKERVQWSIRLDEKDLDRFAKEAVLGDWQPSRTPAARTGD